MPPTSLNGPWVGREFKKYLKVTALCCRFAVALLSNRHHFDSTILTVALGDAILKSEAVHPGLLPARIDSSRAPRGKRLAVSFFDNLINRSACDVLLSFGAKVTDYSIWSQTYSIRRSR